MLATSYYANMKKLENINFISISRYPPAWFTGKVLYQTTIPVREYNGEYIISNDYFRQRKNQVIILTERQVNNYSIKLLAPMSKMFNDFKEDGNEEKFKREYIDKVLDRLDPVKIHNYFKEDSCLLCYETKEDVCHRHFAREWFNNAGLEVFEL